MTEVSLKNFRFDRPRKRLIGSSKLFDGHFPRDFQIVSNYTGRVVTFRCIGPDHPLYDEDHWDGEQQVYEATETDVAASVAVICHGF